MKTITIKQFEPGELTELELEFYKLFSATGAKIAEDNKGMDQNVLIAGITRSLMQVAGNALALANILEVNTDV